MAASFNGCDLDGVVPHLPAKRAGVAARIAAAEA
jgi:hypothetical protein